MSKEKIIPQDQFGRDLKVNDYVVSFGGNDSSETLKTIIGQVISISNNDLKIRCFKNIATITRKPLKFLKGGKPMGETFTYEGYKKGGERTYLLTIIHRP